MSMLGVFRRKSCGIPVDNQNLISLQRRSHGDSAILFCFFSQHQSLKVYKMPNRTDSM